MTTHDESEDSGRRVMLATVRKNKAQTEVVRDVLPPLAEGEIRVFDAGETVSTARA